MTYAHPDTNLGPPCPRCERDTVPAKDEDRRPVWRCPDKECPQTEEGEDE